MISEIIEKRPQKDGSCYVRERHVADGGEVWENLYLMGRGDDADVVLALNAAAWAERVMQAKADADADKLSGQERAIVEAVSQFVSALTPEQKGAVGVVANLIAAGRVDAEEIVG